MLPNLTTNAVLTFELTFLLQIVEVGLSSFHILPQSVKNIHILSVTDVPYMYNGNFLCRGKLTFTLRIIYWMSCLAILIKIC